MRLVAVALAAVALLPGQVGPRPLPSASSGGPGQGVSAVAQGDEFDFRKWFGPTATETLSGSSAKAKHAAAEPRLVEVVPACPGNDLRFGRSDGTMCAAALAACSNGAYLVWVLTTTTMQNPGPDDWSLSNQRCIRPGEDPTGGRPRRVPAFTQEDFARLRLPAGAMHLQPDTGEVLINVPTNAYVTATTITRRTRLLDVEVEVEATPTIYTWTFGDGGRLITRRPGHPYPNMTTTHTYKHPGRYQVTLTTTYTGRYRIVGEPDWLPIDGTVDIPSPPQSLVAYEARAVLVP